MKESDILNILQDIISEEGWDEIIHVATKKYEEGNFWINNHILMYYRKPICHCDAITGISYSSAQKSVDEEFTINIACGEITFCVSYNDYGDHEYLCLHDKGYSISGAEMWSYLNQRLEACTVEVATVAISPTIFTREMAIELLRKRMDGLLIIPEGVTELAEDFALLYNWHTDPINYHFREIHIPSTVQTINGIFLSEYGPDDVPVKKFKSFFVHKDNPNFCSVEGVLFSKDMEKLICFPCGKNIKEYYVPDGVKSICDYAFLDNAYLETIILPKSTEKIGEKAFSCCSKLTHIELPNSLTEIGCECFSLSMNLGVITIPNSITRLYSSVLSDATIMIIPDTIKEIRYDYVPTEWLRMPYVGPAILTRNPIFIDFADSYDYNIFEDYCIDQSGNIWSSDKHTLIYASTYEEVDNYYVPECVDQIFINAFRQTHFKYIIAPKPIRIIGRTTDMMNGLPSSRAYKVICGFLHSDDVSDISFESITHPSTDADKSHVFTSFSSSNSNQSTELDKYLTQNGSNCSMDQEYAFTMHLLGACAKLQSNENWVRNTDENGRNTYIKDLLSTAGYQVNDQTLSGLSPTAKSAGEVDLKVYGADGLPFTILEALNITADYPCSWNRKNLSEHINKLYAYDANGLSRNYVIVYATTPDFGRFVGEVQKLIENRVKCPYGAADLISVAPVDTDFSDLSLTCAKYHRNGKEIRLYIMCVRLAEKKTAAQTST